MLSICVFIDLILFINNLHRFIASKSPDIVLNLQFEFLLHAGLPRWYTYYVHGKWSFCTKRRVGLV